MRTETESRLRVDAQRNRERILAAAREVFVTHGPEAPLDSIARRAGVGIATVYRRFPDRDSLVHGVAMDTLTRVLEAIQTAVAEEQTAYEALRRFMHTALEIKVGSVMPALVGRIVIDGELNNIRKQAAVHIQAAIDQAQADGDLRSDAVFGDVLLMTMRVSRPLPAVVAADRDLALAHRQLDIYLDGLRVGTYDALPGPAFTPADFDDLVERVSAQARERD